MKIRYEDWNPKGTALQVIGQAESICADYARQGYDLTLRQLYYRFVALDLFPEDRRWVQVGNGRWVRSEDGTINAEPNYKWLGDIVAKARMSGRLSWSYIKDRTRSVSGVSYYPESVESIIESMAYAYSVDHWQDQPFYVEVWVEKQALDQVVERAARPFRAPYFSCRGYVSLSEMWSASNRLREQVENGKTVVVLHLGDHDPSGVDMTRDIVDRSSLFTMSDFLRGHRVAVENVLSNTELSASAAVWQAMADGTDRPDLPPIEVRRIALNMDQIREHNPPPNPAKITDSRSTGYIAEHGDESWELDALDPSILHGLITDEIETLIDWDLWAVHEEDQERERARLRRIGERWQEIAAEFDEEG